MLGADGRGKLVMSTTAWRSLEEQQKEQLRKVSWVEEVAKHRPLLFSQLIGPRFKRNVEEPCQVDVDLVLCSIPTIERVGGGGIR